jgi:trk system potassium uptake protein TrkH
MRFNFWLVVSIMGLLITLNGLFMILTVPFAIHYSEDWLTALLSFSIVLGIGLPLWLIPRRFAEKELKRKDGFLVVTFGWIFISLTGALPYVITGAIPSFTDAFFETVSGYTTTGASILNDIEALPRWILFWRSMTQWIGGMGIIVLTVAILPILGIGGMQLFIAEAPGISPDKLKPRIQDTAKRLWLIYLTLTVAEILLLKLGGMSFYDAINHGLTTMSSGGFSVKQESIGYYDSPFIQYVIIFFMIMAGTNFTLTYFVLKGKFQKFWSNEEYRFYIIGIFIASLLVTAGLIYVGERDIEGAFRSGFFQVVSIVTTTGFVTADYTSWAPFVMIIIFLLMFVGGSAGSTAGGIKVIRHIILLKNSWLELKRMIHPSAILPVRFNGNAINKDITVHVLAFMILYIFTFAAGTAIISITGLDFTSSMGAVIATLGNIGPGLGSVGPVENFAHVTNFGKWVLSFLMLVGRLELFTVFILLSPFYWQRA